MSKYLNNIDFSRLEEFDDEDNLDMIYEQIEERDKERSRKTQLKMREYYDVYDIDDE